MAISSVGSNARPGVCTSTTRPTTPFEGQMIYETDTDMLAIWNGSAWRYVAATTPTNGSVLQVVDTNTTTAQASSSTTYASTGLSTSITPKSSSSKILVIASINGCEKTTGNTGSGVNLRLRRGSTTVSQFALILGYTNTSLDNIASGSICYMDNPATTSSTTYTVEFANNVAAGTVRVQANNIMSSMVLMEIAG